MSELPSSWVLTSLGDIAEHPQYGFTTSSRQHGTVKLLRITDISSGRVDWSTVPFCEDVPADLEKYLLKLFDIVVARSGATVGSSFMITTVSEVPSVFASYLIRFRATDAVLPRYLSHYLKSRGYWEFISQSSSGIAQPNVNGTKLRDLPIPLAPLNEQKRIVVKLDELLPKVEACKQRLEKIPTILKRFRQSVLAAAVSGRLSEQWRSSQSNVTHFPNLSWISKPDWAEEFPDTWKYCRVSEVLDWIEAGKNFTCSGDPVKAGAVGLVKISAVTWDEFDPTATKTVTDKKFINPKLFINEGDLLVSRANTRELLGSSVIVRKIDHKIMISDKVWRLHLKDYSKGFFHLFLKSHFGRNQLEAAATGNQTAMFNISQKSFSDMIVPFPPFTEQEHIYSKADALISIDNVLRVKVEGANTTLSRTADSILARAFRGELTSQDPTDEPASVLLDRIKASPSSKVIKSGLRKQKREKEEQSASA